MISNLRPVCSCVVALLFLSYIQVGLMSDPGPGDPLLLTPYIEKGQIKEALTLSEVNLVKSDTSYSGYFTVNKEYDSNMFFWFFPNKNVSAPVLLWLQGGPGGSSLLSLFMETGPYQVDENLKLSKRDIAWTNKYSVLYIDNPVGAGFSFTNKSAGYRTDQPGMADDLYSALIQFFQLFPEFSTNNFYVTGESYAGKYIPAISYKIHTANLNKSNPHPINLKGLAIGNGWCEPQTMIVEYADYFFQLGLLDGNQRAYLQKHMELISESVRNGFYRESFDMLNQFISVANIPYSSWLTNQTGCDYRYNFMLCTTPADFNNYPKYVNQTAVRLAIHVGETPYYPESETVMKYMYEDVMKSSRVWIEALLNAKYKMMFYTGALDIIVALPLTEAFLQTLDWSGSLDYKRAGRSIWKVNSSDTEVAGYTRQADNLLQVIVKGGGHMIPYDQPERSFDMIDRFVRGQSFGPAK